jgi:hypothetical protein
MKSSTWKAMTFLAVAQIKAAVVEMTKAIRRTIAKAEGVEDEYLARAD